MDLAISDLLLRWVLLCIAILTDTALFSKPWGRSVLQRQLSWSLKAGTL